MKTLLTRPITLDEIAAYQTAGVVLLKNILDLNTVNTLRRTIDTAIDTIDQSPAGYDFSALSNAVDADDFNALEAASDGQHNVADIARYLKASGSPFLRDNASGKGHFLLDTGVASRLREFNRIVRRGMLPEIAATFLDSQKVNFFGDQIFVKEPGTRERTAFHQDATYFEIEGDQCCVMWIPVDPTTIETGTMRYLRGSHKDGRDYQPNVFVSRAPLPGAVGEKLPDIDADPAAFGAVHFDTEPGDIIVHHYKTVHGTGGNTSRYQVRRAASLRYCGDDIRFRSRPYAPRQLHHKARLTDGDPLSGPDFPVVWRRQKEAA